MADPGAVKPDGSRPRARELGLRMPGTPGPWNAITDVPGVLVGCTTVSSYADPALRIGPLPVLTGVTAILPRGFDPVPRPVWAGQSTLNGNGEMTGSHWVRDGGYFVGPVMLTNTTVLASSITPRPGGSSITMPRSGTASTSGRCRWLPRPTTAS